MAADSIIRCSGVWTGLPGQPRAEAVAIAGGQILAVGAWKDLKSLATPQTNTIERDGLLIPAFSDLHTHFLLASLALDDIDLRQARGREDIQTALKKAVDAGKPEGWIVGINWDDEGWADGSPDRTWIEEIVRDTPVALYRHDLHQAVCNGAALAAAGFDDTSQNPEGGHLGRFDDGRLNGRVYERAMTIVRNAIPEPDQERKRRAIRNGQYHAASLGITAITDMIDGPQAATSYFAAAAAGELTCRFELCCPLPRRQALFDAGIRGGVGLGPVHFGPMKGFMDGSLGSRTAHMSQPYAGDPGNCGYPLEMADPPEKLLDMMRQAVRHGFSCAVHAIGDEANRRLLNLFTTLRDEGAVPPVPFRVEHAQHLTDDLLPCFARAGAIASMQPVHLVVDGRYAERLLGSQRARTSYRVRGLLDAGATVMFNTDWPVVPLDPLAGIAAAVTRQTAEGRAWLPHEAVTVEEALHAYTSVPAAAWGQAGHRGVIASGAVADLALLSGDITTAAPDRLKNISVHTTWFEGRQIYPREQ